MWYATRWQTYHLVAAQVGGKELQKHGIRSAQDLLSLPWDKEDEASEPEIISEDEAKRLQNIMKANPFLMFGNEQTK